MLVEFLYELRRRGVAVSSQEWLGLMKALALGLHESSLDGFYHLARACLVKDVARFDAFDTAFAHTFRGATSDALALVDELRDWLKDAKNQRSLPPEELAKLTGLPLDELRELFRKRLQEQKERHDGGSKWIGTGGTSPFGRGGRHPAGIRLGEGGGKSAVQVAEERRFRAYRKDLVLDVRQIDLALRLLRDLGRDGAPIELDLDGTIEATARNLGDIEVVQRPLRRNRTKVTLLMDVGGSMDEHTHLVERLFTAASRNGRFARFRAFYFHNCVYEHVYEDERFRQPVPVSELIGTSDRSEKLVIVGDAAMHPWELLERGGSMDWARPNQTPGLEWLRLLRGHFERTAWLNPLPESEWYAVTTRVLRGLWPMYPLTIAGLEGAVRQLVRGGAARA